MRRVAKMRISHGAAVWLGTPFNKSVMREIHTNNVVGCYDCQIITHRVPAGQPH